MLSVWLKNAESFSCKIVPRNTRIESYSNFRFRTSWTMFSLKITIAPGGILTSTHCFFNNFCSAKFGLKAENPIKSVLSNFIFAVPGRHEKYWFCESRLIQPPKMNFRNVSISFGSAARSRWNVSAIVSLPERRYIKRSITLWTKNFVFPCSFAESEELLFETGVSIFELL